MSALVKVCTARDPGRRPSFLTIAGLMGEDAPSTPAAVSFPLPLPLRPRPRPSAADDAVTVNIDSHVGSSSSGGGHDRTLGRQRTYGSESSALSGLLVYRHKVTTPSASTAASSSVPGASPGAGSGGSSRGTATSSDLCAFQTLNSPVNLV